MANPLVSVCIPSYNHAQFVGRAVSSVLRQTLADLEVIVLDDVSTDETMEVLSRIDDRRLTIKRNAVNLGPGGTTNACLAQAKGRFVALLASDDWMRPERLAKQVAALEANPSLGAIFSAVTVADETGAILESHAFSPQNRSRYAWLNTFFHDGNCLSGVTVTFRSEALRATGLYNPLYRQLQDYDYWIRLCSQYEIEVLDEPLTVWTQHSSQRNLSASQVGHSARCRWEVQKILRAYTQLSVENLQAVFPDDDLNVPDTRSVGGFILMQAALLSSSAPVIAFGLDLLFELMSDPATSGLCREAGYTWSSLSELITAHDPYGDARSTEQVAYIRQLEKSVDDQRVYLEQIPSMIEKSEAISAEQVSYIRQLEKDVESQKSYIDQLLSRSEKERSDNIEQKAYIQHLENAVAEQISYIKELSSANDEKFTYIKKLENDVSECQEYISSVKAQRG